MPSALSYDRHNSEDDDMSLFLLAIIIALLSVCFGGYFGWFGTPWKGFAPGGGIGLLLVVLILVLVMSG